MSKIKSTARQLGRWLSIKQASAHAGVSEKTIDRWLKSGDLPASRNGRIVRIDAHDLDAFLRRFVS